MQNLIFIVVVRLVFFARIVNRVLRFNFQRVRFSVKFQVKFYQNSKLTRFDSKVFGTGGIAKIRNPALKEVRCKAVREDANYSKRKTFKVNTKTF